MRKITFGILILCMSTCIYFSFRPLLDEPGLTIPEPIGPFLNGNFPDISPSSQDYRPAFPNLTFDSPLTFTTVPNSNRLIVGQRNGMIYSFNNNDNVSQKNLLRDLSNEVGVVWDGGFLGLAIHPEFGHSNKNYFYVYYTTKDSQGRDYPDGFVSGFSCSAENYWGSFLILKRITVDPETLQADPSQDLIMIKMRMFGSTHRGGSLLFGNDGFLYLATGDQSAYAKPQNVTSNLDGGVLRIDVDQDPFKSQPPVRTLQENGRFNDEISGVGYGIPNDNPFKGSNGSRFEEYYTVGHRNPHRMTKDKLTGDLYIGEVGESRHEEINVIKKGLNYGWPVYEGNYDTGTTCTGLLDDMDHESPLVAFPRSDANALIGGYVYRGASMPNFYGKYICADYGIGEEIWAVNTTTGEYEIITQFSPTDIISFGEDNEGELYLLSQGDGVNLYKMVEGGELEGNVPTLLSETGAFQNLESMTPNDGLVPYNLIESFWSDGAEKKRWMAIPNDGTYNTVGEQISFSEAGDWQFPIGAVLVKHFELPIDENNHSKTKRLETRFSIKASNGSFYFLTYKWNEQETDAVLLEGGAVENIPIKQVNGSTVLQTWNYPSTQDCVSCHNPVTGGSLGPRTRYLNTDFTYKKTGVTSNQLITLSHLGILNEIIDDVKTQQYQTYKALSDATASLDERARSYLDLNCAYCHRPGGTGERAQFDLQLFNDLNQTRLLTVGVNTPLGIEGEQIITPGVASKSILFHRMNTIDQTIMMPPISKNKTDVLGVQLIEQWINQLETPTPAPAIGEYRIVNRASGNTLQVPDAGLADRANVAVGDYTGLSHQQFALENAAVEGYFQFKALHSGKYMDVKLGNTAPDTDIWQYVGNGSAAQLWELLDAGDDTFHIVSKLSGFYLGENTDGNVSVMTNNPNNAIRWEFLPTDDVEEQGIIVSTTSVTTSEDGNTADFTIQLKTAPISNVVLMITGVDNTDEYSLSVSELIFTPTNWDTAQTVTVTGKNDEDPDGTQNYTINITVDESRSDTSYAGLSAVINGVNLDNDRTCNGILTDVSEPVGSGTITSRNDFIPAEDRFKAFDNKSSRENHSKWLDADGIPTSTDPSWIQIVLTAPKRVEILTLTSANDEKGRDPSNFRLLGSNGGTFTELGNWSGQVFTQRYQSKTYELTAPGSYTTYKLEITKNNGDLELTQLAEIELLGCDQEPVNDTPVDTVELNRETLQMAVGTTIQLQATVLPTNATDKTVEWSSNDPSIATVDNTGNVTAMGLGNTLITVSTNDGNFTATSSITVEEETVDDGTCNGTLVDVTEPVGSGTITSRNDFIPAEDRFKAFDNKGVQGNHSKWLDAGGIPTSSDPSWIQMELPASKRVEAITITSANDDYGRDPKDFRLMASNGGAFTEVGSWSGQTFTLRYQARTFVLVLPGTYSTYRLEITKNDENVEMTQVAEIEFLGCDSENGSDVQVTNVELTPETLEMNIGTTAQLEAFVQPADATDNTVIWLSNDPSIATVDNAGNVSAIESGSTLITVTTNDGNFSATSSITVEEESVGSIPVTNVELTPETLEMTIGTTAQLEAFVQPADATDNTVVWSSHDPSIATVDNAGNVSAIESGSTLITVTTNDGNFTATSSITVEEESVGSIPVTNVELTPETLELTIGTTAQLEAFVQPAEATDNTVVWSSHDPSIATVDNAGNVSAIESGSTLITVTTNDGNFTATSSITVEEETVDDGTCNGTLIDVTEPVGSGTITSRNDFIPAEDRFKAFDNKGVQGNHSKWLDAGGIPTSSDPSWIQMELPASKRVEAITITSANDDYGRDPKDFRLMASNGGAFTEVGSWSGQTFTLRYQARTFVLALPGTYSTYRLEITKNDENVEMTQVAEIEFLGCDSENGSDVQVTNVELTPETLEMTIGTTAQLEAFVQPADATDNTVVWSSHDPSIATVDNAGNVSAIESGSTLITVTTNDGNFSATSTITVEDETVDDSTCNGTIADVSEPVGSGTITSRNDFVPAENRFKAFDNKSIKGNHSKWLDAAGIPTGTNPSWIQIALIAPKRVEAITITSANDDYGRDPKDFRLMASNGGAFTEVGSWSNQTFTLRYQTKTFDLAVPGTYTTYRLEITKNDQDVEMTQLAEIELLGCDANEPMSISVKAKLNNENTYGNENNFSFAPNPVGEDRKILLQLTSSLTDTQVSVIIYGMEGKRVHSSKFLINKFDFSYELQLDSSLPAGIYLMEIKNNEMHVFRKKIILK